MPAKKADRTRLSASPCEAVPPAKVLLEYQPQRGDLVAVVGQWVRQRESSENTNTAQAALPIANRGECGAALDLLNPFRVRSPSPVHKTTDARATTPGRRRLGAQRICPRIRDRRSRKLFRSRKRSCDARQPAKRRSCLYSPKKRKLPVPGKQVFYSTRWPEPVPDGISENRPTRKRPLFLQEMATKRGFCRNSPRDFPSIFGK